MKIVFFDICAIPLFLMILFVCYSRRMTKGTANMLFIYIVHVSLISTIADLCLEAPLFNLPLTKFYYILCTVSAYVYFILRNATNVILLLFLLHLTKTAFLMRKKWTKIAFSLPYLCILALLVINPFNSCVFSLTMEEGYSRGPMMMVLYVVALLYAIIGFAYSIYCRRYLTTNKLISLLSIYLLGYVAVIVQFFYPEIMIELFCTALGEMLIMLSIMRPEERMDSETGILSWASYQADLKNVLLSKDNVQIVVIQMLNSKEIRNYLGDHAYNSYVTEIADAIRSIYWGRLHRTELYFERPGTLYLIISSDDIDRENIAEHVLSEIDKKLAHYTETGVSFDPAVCLIHCPKDLQKAEDIISLGHKFTSLDKRKQDIYYAADIVHSQNFAIEAHIEEIINRAIRDKNIEMYYQPIYDVQSLKFHSAEALARIRDPEYGLISPGVFIPAAESLGLIVAIGDEVLEQVYRFISENDLDSLSLSYIEVNLSVAQCMEKDLPEKILALQKKYNVDPGRINLEITETVFENISDVMVKNVNALVKMGYGFALDDYGIGYSNIQRVNNLPLDLIKIDKSILDEVSYENGKTILEYTIRMMQSVDKQLVAEGAETSDVVDMLKDMGCDYIQGFYFSKPLPVNDFLGFIEENNIH